MFIDEFDIVWSDDLDFIVANIICVSLTAKISIELSK